MPQPIQYDSAHLDLSARLAYSKTVAGSPALAAITSICTVTVPGDIAVVTGIVLTGWCAFTAGTSAVSALLQLRKTDTSGAVVASTGAVTVVAASLYTMSVHGIDLTAALPGQVYVLALTMASGSAASTVSAVQITALVV